MAISLVQSNLALTNSGTLTQAVTFTSNTTSGNLIVVSTVKNVDAGGLGVITGITDSNGNTYQQAIAQNGNGVVVNSVEIWYAYNITGGTTPTVTVTWSLSNRPAATIREYSGIATTSPLDVTLGFTQVSQITSWSMGPSSSTSQADELVIVAVGATGGSPSAGLWSLGSGFSNLQSQVASTTARQGVEDKIISSTGTQSATITSNNNVSGAMALATFKATAGATTTQTQTGITRITASTSRTQTGVSRVTSSTTKTQTGKANIVVTGTTTKTQIGVARITASTTRTQTGKARITASTTRTQTGVSRIGLITGKTQTGIARITISTPKIQTGKARITATQSQFITGKARITKQVSQTITGKARIGLITQKAQTGKANITVPALVTTKTITGTARIIFGFDIVPPRPPEISRTYGSGINNRVVNKPFGSTT